MHSWHALLNIANKPCAICSQGPHMGQHMNGVKVGATTIFLDIMAGSNIRHALGFGALCKLQCLLQLLVVGIVAGHGCHNLISVCFWAIPWEEFQAAWTSCGKSGKVSSTWDTMMSHGQPSVHSSGSLGFHNRLAG